MNYPFSADQFVTVMGQYNLAVWPVQILLYILAILAVILVFRSSTSSSRTISVILAFLWLWMGVVYHWMFFTSINPAAKIFGAVFVIQALMFLYFGFIRKSLEFRFDKIASAYAGMALVSIGLVIYPIVGLIIGHVFPNNPTFGLPCPTTIFTLGLILLMTNKRTALKLVIIPFLWSILGFMAAISFGIKEDVLLLISGIICLILVVINRWSVRKAAIAN